MLTAKTAKIFGKGLATGLTLQLAIGPVFFFVANLALQRTVFDGLAAVGAVTLVDFFYITLSIVGIGKLLEKKEARRPLGIISSLVLMIFGALMLRAAMTGLGGLPAPLAASDLAASFLSTFALTISSPMTIVFFTGIFAAKATENNFSKRGLAVFGLGTGLATLIFMGLAVVVFSAVRTAVPTGLMRGLNVFVGLLLVAYGVFRLAKMSVSAERS